MSSIDRNLQWYKDAIIYELHIKAFSDSNGDGIGDINGLLSRLDYLQDLGVTAIWLLPFYPSPQKDDGYDIADYYSINPSYGDLDDFRRLLQEAHERGLRVIIELVINHTSDRHPWFQRARQAPAGSELRDYYVWSDDPTRYADVRIIFQDFEVSNWTWDPVAGQYYWHRFFSHQPDLNFDNPEVRQEVFRIIDYWCEMGVDGFRLDAVPYLFEREGTNGENLPETHKYLKELRAHLDQKYPGTLLLAEANMWPEDSAAYFGNGDECQMNYHFPLMPRMYMALQMEDRFPIIDILEQTPAIPKSCQWAIFLRNHDELTLEMVTDEERDYMYKVYVKDPKARINLGIRHRLAPLMENNRKKIELLNCLLFSLPGTPVLYYGDEIGMGDNFYLGDRDGVRTPMQWSPERNGGFSKASPHQLYLPVIQDLDFHYESVNVEVQKRNSSSLLWWMKRIIEKRRHHPAFSQGDMNFVGCANAKVLAFTRSHEGQTVLIVANLSRYAQPVLLELNDFATAIPVELFSKNRFPVIGRESPYFLSLSAYECQWFMLSMPQGPESVSDQPSMNAQSWEEMLTRTNTALLEEVILPSYLHSAAWMTRNKLRTIDTVKILKSALLPADPLPCYILVVEVTFLDGLPEIYQLPVGLAVGQEGDTLNDKHHEALIARVHLPEASGILYDAFFGSGFHQAIYRLALEGSAPDLPIRYNGEKPVCPSPTGADGAKPQILSGNHGSSLIAFGSNCIFKLFRRLDSVLNPDAELTAFLTDRSSLTPRFLGTLEWGSMTLGMIQEYVSSATNGWILAQDKIDDLVETLLASPELNGSTDATKPAGNGGASFLNNTFEGSFKEQIKHLAVRTAELHKILAFSSKQPAFAIEKFSLHYQRSLFAGMKSLVRSALQVDERRITQLEPLTLRLVRDVVADRDQILAVLRQIYTRKYDVIRMRIHGDYHLGRILFRGKDVFIFDFEGDPSRSFSDRRIKRSPIRDVATMIRSLHYTAFSALIGENNVPVADFPKILPLVEDWYAHMSRAFLLAYTKDVGGTGLIPESTEDIETLLQICMLERALVEFKYEMAHRPGWIVAPASGIKSILAQASLTQSTQLQTAVTNG